MKSFVDCRYNPACAGTTPVATRPVRLLSIQPRVCGDYVGGESFGIYSKDTTPRVRGLHIINRFFYLTTRYNPACAGTTNLLSAISLRGPIQPRVCGDYLMVQVHLRPPFDTTPRVRGLPQKGRLFLYGFRYNPACAGTTATTGDTRAAKRIQPRVCGDYAWRTSIAELRYDTTPRVRGLLIGNPNRGKAYRYNPACAGTTCSLGYYLCNRTIQPRVCGDYTKESLALEPFYHN